MQLEILNTRERKAILKTIRDRWGCDFRTDLVFLLSSKSKIYLMNKEIEKIDDRKLRIDKMGMYFGELMKNNELRLSIEGSQLIGPLAKNNIVELDNDRAKAWLKGENIVVSKHNTADDGFVIIKNRSDFMGCGKLKEKEILNYVPKTRRILAD